MFEDDGLSTDAAHVEIAMAYNVDPKSGCVNFTVTSSGSYFRAPEQRHYSLRVVRPAGHKKHGCDGAGQAFDQDGQLMALLPDCEAAMRRGTSGVQQQRLGAGGQGWCELRSAGDVLLVLRPARNGAAVSAAWCGGQC